MSKTTVRVDVTRLRLLRAGLEGKAQQILDKATFDVEADAKKMAPVDTGFLRNSIASELGRLLNRVVAGAEYAIYQEFGTRFMSAQPFMIPALERHRKAFLAAWKDLLK